MLKTMWLDFWNRLDTKGRDLVKGIAGVLVLAAVLTLVVNVFTDKPKADPLLDQYGQAMRDAGAQIKKDSSGR